jgi:hypothetical protein
MPRSPTAAAVLLALVAVAAIACDYNLTLTGPTISNANTSTNTNTNQNPITFNLDIHDVVSFLPTPGTAGGDGTNPPGNGSPTAPLPIPTTARPIAEAVAAANPLLLANSCQDTLGPAAWAFLDLEVTTLRASDTRWGYLGKGGVCTNPSRDVIAYKATATDVGIWGVDIIGSHCPTPPAVSTFTWNVIGYDAAGKWCFPRQ